MTASTRHGFHSSRSLDLSQLRAGSIAT